REIIVLVRHAARHDATTRGSAQAPGGGRSRAAAALSDGPFDLPRSVDCISGAARKALRGRIGYSLHVAHARGMTMMRLLVLAVLALPALIIPSSQALSWDDSITLNTPRHYWFRGPDGRLYPVYRGWAYGSA